MNHRERFIAVLQGRKPEKIPWVPRLDIWYNYHSARGTLPEKYQGMTMDEIRIKLGAGKSAREGKVFKEVMPEIEIKEEEIENELIRYLVTPVGTVSEKYKSNPNFRESSPLKVEYFIKDIKDYEIMKYVIEHTFYEETFAEYREYDEKIGEDGLPLCPIGDVPINLILREYIGYNNAYYELADHKDKILELHEALLEKYQELKDIVLQSPAEFFLHGMHFDSQMTPPVIFKKYVVPYYQDFTRELHQSDKWVAAHQDADASQLLELYLETGIDVVDCFATYPLVNCRFEDAINAWGKSIGIWGGIPSILLCQKNVSDREFEEELKKVFENVDKGRVIFGVADNVMPETDINRLERVSEKINAF